MPSDYRIGVDYGKGAGADVPAGPACDDPSLAASDVQPLEIEPADPLDLERRLREAGIGLCAYPEGSLHRWGTYLLKLKAPDAPKAQAPGIGAEPSVEEISAALEQLRFDESDAGEAPFEMKPLAQTAAPRAEKGSWWPDIELPEFRLPEFRLPEFKLPEFEPPEIPEIKAPQWIVSAGAFVKERAEEIAIAAGLFVGSLAAAILGAKGIIRLKRAAERRAEELENARAAEEAAKQAELQRIAAEARELEVRETAERLLSAQYLDWQLSLTFPWYRELTLVQALDFVRYLQSRGEAGSVPPPGMSLTVDFRVPDRFALITHRVKGEAGTASRNVELDPPESWIDRELDSFIEEYRGVLGQVEGIRLIMSDEFDPALEALGLRDARALARALVMKRRMMPEDSWKELRDSYTPVSPELGDAVPASWIIDHLRKAGDTSMPLRDPLGIPAKGEGARPKASEPPVRPRSVLGLHEVLKGRPWYVDLDSVSKAEALDLLSRAAPYLPVQDRVDFEVRMEESEAALLIVVDEKGAIEIAPEDFIQNSQEAHVLTDEFNRIRMDLDRMLRQQPPGREKLLRANLDVLARRLMLAKLVMTSEGEWEELERKYPAPSAEWRHDHPVPFALVTRVLGIAPPPEKSEEGSGEQKLDGTMRFLVFHSQMMSSDTFRRLEPALQTIVAENPEEVNKIMVALSRDDEFRGEHMKGRSFREAGLEIVLGRFFAARGVGAEPTPVGEVPRREDERRPEAEARRGRSIFERFRRGAK
jgi:hypothetical protein